MVHHSPAHSAADCPDWATESAAWTIRQALAIQQIAAPTFAEAHRAAYVADQFRALGLARIETDTVQNAYGCVPGARSGQNALMVTADTDTIFNTETDLAQRIDGDAVFGPGLGDNSFGVAALLALSRWLVYQPQPPVDVWFVATSREEGLGDLGGMKAAFAHLRPAIAAVINLEGLALGHVYHAGIAVRRLKVTAHADGGHSWLHYGRPSALHALVELCTDLLRIVPPRLPRTTFNIGLIEGGDAINAIASHAACWLDLRSESTKALAHFETHIMDTIADAASRGPVQFTVDVVGDRPAGQIPVNHPLVQIGVASLHDVGLRAVLDTGSTDANVPLAAGCPAITLGVTRGGNAHRTDEFAELTPVTVGIRHLVGALQATLQHLTEP